MPEFGFENSQPEWNTQQQLWILAQISEHYTQRDIYNSLTDKKSNIRPVEVDYWTGTFEAFKKRLQRLTKNGIDPAIDTNTGQKCEFDLGTANGRYDYWVWLAKTTTALPTRIQALQMIEKLAPQHNKANDTIRQEIETYSTQLLSNPHIFVEIIALQLQEKLEANETEWIINTLISWICSVPVLIPRVLAGIIKAYPIKTNIKENNDDNVE